MSIQIPIDAIPNQKLSVNLDGFRFDISLISSTTSTLVTIARNDVTLIKNVRALGGSFLLPYNYLEGESGNFLFIVKDDVIPYYINFGITQILVYGTVEDLELARG